MEKIVLIIVVSITLLVTGGVLLVLLFEPVEIADVAASRIRIDPVDTSRVVSVFSMENHFLPLYASPSEVISSMLEVGEEAENVRYVAYYRLNKVDYAVLQTGETEITVRVGEQVAPSYIVYGITEFAVLLNDTSTNSFFVVKYFRS
ncbi:alpha/beta hydrolase [Mesotoga sp. Brook.08.YT.4.2.5.1]|jgi:hypothetical protein|uniref:Uncharacterized protein n=1 Tax=Mesotoga prima TaxID=1184387 RepID=A0A101HSK5_9BACT|nr:MULTISPECIES: alpha/beta hydrolase [unclassified Mesotoga]KUK82049.1 MAG: Uncharacterized protein XD94_0192 [Mesotoga prima]RAM61246.1 alpha/beta hydrolase [Mesotoga sp. SC_3PWM13N19]MDD3461207.1 alpha/beta hydrolase [Mesotoga sp.]PNE23025.1 alpha/beta hydrolase [Mesotoga sp. Brook.08.YT.4.2.5.1]PNS42046.1 alpha/beta hydrolase [Mesotoga sp. B105.6.4]